MKFLNFQKFYETYDEALNDAKQTKIFGFVQFSANFTQDLALFNDDAANNDYSDNGVIQIFLDQTDLQKTSFIQQKLYDSYQKFTEKLMVACGKSKKAGNIPIVFAAAFGDMNFDLKLTILPGIVLAYVSDYFFLAKHLNEL